MLLKPSKRHHGAGTVGEIGVVWVDDAHVVRVVFHVDVVLHVAEDDCDERIVRRVVDGGQIGEQRVNVLHQFGRVVLLDGPSAFTEGAVTPGSAPTMV